MVLQRNLRQTRDTLGLMLRFSPEKRLPLNTLTQFINRLYAQKNLPPSP